MIYIKFGLVVGRTKRVAVMSYEPPIVDILFTLTRIATTPGAEPPMPPDRRIADYRALAGLA
jgi:hypothetical protein